MADNRHIIAAKAIEMQGAVNETIASYIREGKPAIGACVAAAFEGVSDESLARLYDIMKQSR